MEQEEANEKTSQRKSLYWITIVIAAVLILVTLLIYNLVFIYPENQVSQLGITNVTDKANFINQYRATSIQLITTIAQILGGIAVVIGIYIGWGNLKVALATFESNQNKARDELKIAQDALIADQNRARDELKIAQDTLEANMKIAQDNLKVAQEGQITERFTKAVQQLGSDKIEIRLGGIYALERIANESDKDYWQIMEILTNFVRINSPVKDWNNKIQELKTPSSEHIKDNCKVRVDIQAVINVIGRRKHFLRAGEQKPLYLRHTYLRMISLYDALNGARLNSAYPNGAHLEEAFLDFSDLIGATFNGAYLEKTYFVNSCLNLAQFEYARLKGAYFERCYLKNASFYNADLSDANIQNADLTKANFSNANLTNANFEGSILIEARNLTVDQLSKASTLYHTELDPELEAELRAKGFGYLLDVKQEE